MTTPTDLPIVLTEMLLRFYGWGAERNFSQVWDVYSRRPYDPLLRALRSVGGFSDLTDINDEVSFSFSTASLSIRLSMIGPYAVVLEGPTEGLWYPVSAAEDGDLAQVLGLVSAGGFELLDRDLLERSVSIWDEDLSVYAALFVNDDRLPWL